MKSRKVEAWPVPNVAATITSIEEISICIRQWFIYFITLRNIFVKFILIKISIIFINYKYFVAQFLIIFLRINHNNSRIESRLANCFSSTKYVNVLFVMFRMVTMYDLFSSYRLSLLFYLTCYFRMKSNRVLKSTITSFDFRKLRYWIFQFLGTRQYGRRSFSSDFSLNTWKIAENNWCD